MSWDGKRVAISGAGGFIGSHLAEAAVSRGAEVRALVEYSSEAGTGMLAEASPELVDAIELQFGDIRDPECCRRLVEGCDVLFHLAALIAIPYSYENPTAVFETNLNGSLNLALAARDAGIGRFIHTSTSEVYGTAQTVPITEHHPINAQSPYAASKAAADQLMGSFHAAYELPVTVVRPFNTYGPRQSMRAVLPTIAVQAVAGGPVRLGSLTPRRDMTYVADTVEGFLAAADRPGLEGATLQLGTGTDHSVGEMVEAVGRAVGRELEVIADPQRQRPAGSEVMRLISDPSRMSAATGWEPSYDLDAGIGELVGWVERNLSRFRPDEYVR